MSDDDDNRSGPKPGYRELDIVIDLNAYRHQVPLASGAGTTPHDEDAVWNRLRAAQSALEAGDYRDALMELVPLISLDGADEAAQAQTHAQIGSTLMELRQYHAATDYLSHALSYYAVRGDRHHLEVLRALIVACCHIGAVDVACGYLDEYESVAANRADTNDLEAIVNWARGDYGRARENAENCLRTDPGLTRAQLVLAKLDNRAGAHHAVITRWDNSGRREDDERLLREVAVAYEALGDLASAYRCERTAADVAESRTLTLSMLGELIEADFGRFGARRNDPADAQAIANRPAPADASETAMAVVQAEVDELHAVIDQARQLPAHDKSAAHQLAAELEGYVARMNRALEEARQPKPPSGSAG